MTALPEMPASVGTSDARQTWKSVAQAQVAAAQAEQDRREQAKRELLASLLTKVDPSLVEAARRATAAVVTVAEELRQAEVALAQVKETAPASSADDDAWIGAVWRAEQKVVACQRRHTTAVEARGRAAAIVAQALDGARLRLLAEREQAWQQAREEKIGRFHELWRQVGEAQAAIRQLDAEEGATCQVLRALDVRSAL